MKNTVVSVIIWGLSSLVLASGNSSTRCSNAQGDIQFEANAMWAGTHMEEVAWTIKGEDYQASYASGGPAWTKKSIIVDTVENKLLNESSIDKGDRHEYKSDFLWTVKIYVNEEGATLVDKTNPGTLVFEGFLICATETVSIDEPYPLP